MADQNPLLSVIDLQPAPDKPDIVVSALCRNGTGISLGKTAKVDDLESVESLHRELVSQCAALPSHKDALPAIRSLAMKAFGDVLGEGKLECADGRAIAFEVNGEDLKLAYALAEKKLQNSNFPQTPEMLARLDAAQLSILNLAVARNKCTSTQIPIDFDKPEMTHGLPPVPIKVEQTR